MRVANTLQRVLMVAALAAIGVGTAYGGTGVAFTLAPSATTTMHGAPAGSDALGVQANEIDAGVVAGDDDEVAGGGSDNGFSATVVNRSIARSSGVGPKSAGLRRAKSNPELVKSFDGVNFHDQRFANGGNQFSVEPPDQALCAGNGFVLESVNDVLRVFDAAGNAVTPVIDLNTFYGYPAAIDRTKSPLQFGPSITDPSCLFDPDTQRWFHVVLTLDRASPFTQSLSGANHLDIAVSTSADPTGSWVVYRLPVQNDGTQGTPDHGCIAQTGPTTFVHGPCLGDYPHIGADANGFYITTNEFNLAAPGFRGAQIYALQKHALAANAASVNVVLFDTADPALGVQLDGTPGFTVWPAQSPAGDFALDTEFLLSSEAVFQDNGVDSRLRVWSITNTSSLDSASPAPLLTARVANVVPYAVPGTSFQKAGNVPLAQCIADPTCAPLVGATVHANPETRVPSNDSRMQQVSFANGKLWGALDTGLVINDTDVQAGIAYFVLNPNSLHVFAQGYVGVENNNVTYPALAVTASGRGAMAFTLLGADHYPSAAYVSLDAKIGAGDLHVAAEGAGPQDGFSGYVPLGGNPRARPRWGDYGAAASDGNTIWIASEYIAQTCDYAQYRAAPFGTCGGTRAALGNWATRVSKLSVGP